MSNIDFSQAITAEDKAAEAEAARVRRIHDECAALIFASIDLNTQMSLTAAATAGALTEADLQSYRDGLAWIEAMKATYREARDNGGDPAWPDCPSHVAELAGRY